MDFSLSDEQRAIQDLAARILHDHVTQKRLAEIAGSNDGIDRVLWQHLAEAQVLGTSLPERFGGSALDLFEFCLVLEEAGRYVAPVPLLPVIMLAALPIAAFGSEAQQSRYLPRVVRGQTLLTAALIEGPFSETARPRTTARRDGTKWYLDGEKQCVPIGQLAEHFLVPARIGDADVGVFLLEAGAAGVHCEAQRVTNGEPQGHLTLTGARVTDDDLLGDPTQGATIVRWISERAALGLCALQLGVVEQALRLTAEYTSSRKQFGRPIATFQGVALRAADAYVDVEAMRSVFWEAAWRVSAGLPASAEIGAAAWWACTAGQRVVHTAQHLHGGIGADVEYPIHRYFLWAKQIELTLGGGAKQLAQLGAELPSI